MSGVTGQLDHVTWNAAQPLAEEIVASNPRRIGYTGEPIVAGKTRPFLPTAHAPSQQVQKGSFLTRAGNRPNHRPRLANSADIGARPLVLKDPQQNDAERREQCDVLMGVNNGRRSS